MSKIIVIGAGGLLGKRVADALEARSHDVRRLTRAQLDITDFDAVRDALRELRPELVINCAAWTDVDGCARDPERALQINGYGAANISTAAYAVGAAIAQISSNEVFDGTGDVAYTEYDATNAANPYGHSKLSAERAIAATNPRHYIIRTAWLFDSAGRNFIHAILNAAKAGKALRVVTDEVANPTHNTDLASAIARLIETGRYGVYHLTNAGSCSRFDFARYVLDCAGMGDVAITPITSDQWPRDSTPPPYAPLANISAALLGITLRDWQEAVKAFVAAE